MALSKEQCATLDALILNDERVVSFRTLSSELKIPVKQAQGLLSDYFSTRKDKVVASWAVTSENDSIRRVSFVQGKRPSVGGDVLFVTVWGVVASKNDVSAKDWMHNDRLREIGLVETPLPEPNELQDNRWNPIRSDSAGWNPGGAAAQQRARMEALSKEKTQALKQKQDTGTVAKVKAEAAEKRKKIQGNKKPGIHFSRPSSSNGTKKKSSYSHSLGASVTKKQRPSPPPVTKKTSAKKTRRVIVIESDDEDDSDESVVDVERSAMEAEAEEAERAALERNENDVVQIDDEFEGSSEKEAKSSEKEESVESKYRSNGAKQKKSMDLDRDERLPQSRNGKRDYITTFGGKPENQTKYRLVEVEEMVTSPNGYIETRRVKKYVDKDGNEKPPEDGGTVEANGDSTNGNAANPEAVDVDNDKTTPVAKKNPKKAAPAHVKKEDNQNGKSKGGSKSKKSNGNIMKYFGKKS